MDLGHILQNLEVAVLSQDLLHIVLEDLALGGRDTVDLLFDTVQDGQGVSEGKASRRVMASGRKER